MKKYFSYLAYHLTMPFLVITMSLTAIVWLTQSLRFIDLIVNKGLSIATFLYLSSLIIPSLLMVILPFALFCSIIYVYVKLINDTELVVFQISGLSQFRLACPAIFVASIVMMIGYLLSLYILPLSYGKFKDQQAFIRDNYASVLLQEGVFSTPIKGLTVYVDERTRSGDLKGIFVHDSRNKEKPVTMMAAEGKLVQSRSGPRFHLIKGNRQEIDDEHGNMAILYFDSYTVDLSVYAEDVSDRWRAPEERYVHELLNVEGVPDYLKGRFKAEGHHRVVWPLYSLALALIGLVVLLSGQFNRRGQWKRVILAVGLAAVVVVIDLVLKSLVVKYPGLTVLMYFNALAVSGLCVYFLISGAHMKMLSRL